MTKTILSTLFISAILITGAIVASVDLTQFAEAFKSKGNPHTKVGSAGSVVCGDRLCSEAAPAPVGEEEAVGIPEPIPGWIKNNAEWWSQGLITEDDFVKGIEFLVKNGIIRV